MLTINVNEYVIAGVKDVYVPAPARGIVNSLKCSFSEIVAAADTVDIQRDTTSVNLITVGAANTAEGVVLTGTPDTTNKELIFDPDSETATDKVLHIVISSLVTDPTTCNIVIEFDDFALTTQ